MINVITDRQGVLARLAPGSSPLAPATAKSAEDCLPAAVLFAIIGGFAALWIFDLSLASGIVAAMFSAVAGALFADG